MKNPPLAELAHQCHDYHHLLARWRRIARATGLTLEAFAQAGEYPIYCVRTPVRSLRPGGLYLSAGIHGDEPAGPAALAEWGETRLPALLGKADAMPLLILPCLNPWGLVENRRSDERGRDLNRLFDRPNIAPIRELRRLVAGRWFTFALSLHEDFDARGIYGYELRGLPPFWGADLLRAGAKVIPIDPRPKIDGRAFRQGLFLRRRGFRRIPLHPESIFLHLEGHCAHSFTFETPSEFSLAARVQTHVRVIDAGVERVGSEEA